MKPENHCPLPAQRPRNRHSLQHVNPRILLWSTWAQCGLRGKGSPSDLSRAWFTAPGPLTLLALSLCRRWTRSATSLRQDLATRRSRCSRPSTTATRPGSNCRRATSSSRCACMTRAGLGRTASACRHGLRCRAGAEKAEKGCRGRTHAPPRMHPQRMHADAAVPHSLIDRTGGRHPSAPEQSSDLRDGAGPHAD